MEPQRPPAADDGPVTEPVPALASGLAGTAAPARPRDQASLPGLVARWFRRVENRSPVVSRRSYQRSLDRFERLADALAHGVRRPDEVLHRWLKEPLMMLDGTVVLFAAFQARGDLAPAAAHYLRALVRQGTQVVLIVNTDDAARPLVLPPDLFASLAGVLVRANHGYDFGAWSHAHALLADRLDPRHLLLANDSVVGPLDDAAFDGLWAAVLGSQADLVGLTESPRPQRHLHSHFLLFGRAAWLGGQVSRFLDQVLAFDDKALVVAIYETRLTSRMLMAGLEVQTVFPALSSEPLHVNDTLDRWDVLLDQGFPFVKANAVRDDPAAVLAHPVVLRAEPGIRALITEVAESRG